ncbi:MAG TPA: hypothetical protein DDX39_02630 [Bacteroidales bacterium]|nr:MAG: hypothetical protein A2W98_03645 [Bacteroidetes bacterium GWF2_33_38]OFY68207.1 MAG: hypothetical protein A2265_01395 [Bacteroidetes bacterium RIFOXYA12_FULL_33_9]OFY84856.1 MAG: hypothetical protein A2236_09285 [Bacteroidetes bacterium RIFOXYA2_FULL_33_7]HBF87512.1 hypothetical protein [Bacteroidales bacterium]
MRFLIVLLFVFQVLLSQAQFFDTLKSCLHKKPKLVFKFDNRYSYVSNNSARILGLKIGIDFGDKYRFGAGWHSLESSVKENYFVDSMGIVIDTLPSFLRMSYLAVFVEYVVYKTRKWEFSIPMQIGYGNSRYDIGGKDGFLPFATNVTSQISKRNVLIYETNFEGHYKIIPYVGIGAGVGYRLMLINNKLISENFNSPIIIFKLKIFLGEIYRGVFRKKETK